MKHTSCLHEESIAVAVQTGSWTDALRTHLSDCVSCQETVQIAGWMHSLAAAEDNSHPLPDARVIWLKANLAQKRASTAEALRPVETFQWVAWGVAALAARLWFVCKVDAARARNGLAEHGMGITCLAIRVGRVAFGCGYPDPRPGRCGFVPQRSWIP